MKKMKQVLAALLAVVMIVAVVPVGEVNAISINDSSVFLHQPTDGDSTCVFTSCLNMFRRRAIIDGDSEWESITHNNYKNTITTNGVSVRWTITDVRGMNASMNSDLTSNKKNYFISMLNNHPEGIVIYCGSNPMHTVLLTDYDSSTDTFYCAETLSSFGYGRIPLTSCYLSTYNGGLSQSSVISKISQIWYVSNRSGGGTPTTAPTYADLGDDFWAYIGNQGCEKWVAGQGTNVQGEACTGDINQMWHFIRQENGSYCILCLSNSYAMDVSNGSSNAGSNLQLMPYVANAAQQFFIYIKDNAYYFKASYANLWIDMDQTTFNVAMWNESNDYAPQKFNIQKIDFKGYLPQNLGDDFYAIIKNSSTGKWVTDSNFNVQGEDAACAYNQIWHFIRHGDRCYSILCNTSYAMDISNLSSNAGSNLQIMPYVANAAQRFYIYCKDGGYYFKSSYTDLMIDMDQSDYNVAMWNCTLDYPPQKFEIIKVNKDFTHTWNSGSVTKVATCVAAGTKTYICTNCGTTTTETIPINVSNHVNTKNVAATPSTCIVKGYTAGVYCNDCKQYISGHAEKPLEAHKTTTQNAKAATCTAEGYTGDQVCSVCKQTITKGTAIPKAAHTTTTINAKDATYDADGYTGDTYCTVCKQTLSYGSVIPKLTKPDEPTNPTNPTNPTEPTNPTTQPTQPQQSGGSCRYCGGTHTGFPGILIGFFHSILALFGLRK